MDRNAAAAYYRFYKAQHGGEIPVFRGGRQAGEGLGDFLRGIFRFLAPVALRGLSTFAGRTFEAHQKGATLKDAAKAAISPTLSSVAGEFGDQMRNRQQQQQVGSGSSGGPISKRSLHKLIATINAKNKFKSGKSRRHKQQRGKTTNKHKLMHSKIRTDVYKRGTRKRHQDGKFAAAEQLLPVNHNF
jgi:hypothetical protein